MLWAIGAASSLLCVALAFRYLIGRTLVAAPIRDSARQDELRRR